MVQHLFMLLFCAGVAPFVSSVSDFKYYLIQDQKTWSDAQVYCRATFTDLAIITSNDDLIQLQNEANRQQFTAKAWLGLYNDLNSWRWSLGNIPPQSFIFWAPGQPNNNGGKQNCGAILANGWDDRNCEEINPFVCFDERKNGSDRYIYESIQLTWSEAQSYCRLYYTDLVSTSDQTEYTLIKDMATPLAFYTWIGLYRRNPWKWIDQTPLSHIVTWAIGKPDNNELYEDCGYLYQNKLDDAVCSKPRAFYCYGVIRKQQTIKVKIQCNEDVNEFKAAILDQIEKNLVDNGMAGNVTVKWKVQSNGAVFHREDTINAGENQICQRSGINWE